MVMFFYNFDLTMLFNYYISICNTYYYNELKFLIHKTSGRIIYPGQFFRILHYDTVNIYKFSNVTSGHLLLTASKESSADVNYSWLKGTKWYKMTIWPEVNQLKRTTLILSHFLYIQSSSNLHKVTFLIFRLDHCCTCFHLHLDSYLSIFPPTKRRGKLF